MSLPCGQRYRGGVSDTLNSRSTGGDPAPGRPATAKIRHRPSWIAFVVVGAIVCVGMGVWQLARYQDVSGTVQNLGYTFMWPFLGGFLIYAYFKYIRLEAEEGAVAAGEGGDEAENDDDEPSVPQDSPRSARRVRKARTRDPVVTEIPADLLPTRRPAEEARVRDEGLRAYNSYLAELAREGRDGTSSQERTAS